MNKQLQINFPLENNGRGLDGGSGGGGCGLQYNKDKSEKEYKYGEKTVLKNPISAFENYYTFGNNGGVGNSYIKEEDFLIKVRGGGGGGAGEIGDNSTDSSNRHSGRGGHGISIEEIDINTGNVKFCPLLYGRYENDLTCYEEEIEDKITNKKIKKLRTKIETDKNFIYWGGGGGAGSFNLFPGDGGKGGGGGGGYYEGIHSTITGNHGIIKENTYVTFPNNPIDKSNHEGKASAVEISESNIDSNIARGGDGISHTGGGGGGGGLASNGGDGGSGIVIIMLKTKEKKIEVKSPEYTLTDIEKMLSEFDNNKKEFGKNLSKLYNYNIKEHKEFYDYIDHIYEDSVLEKNIPHNIIKHRDNKTKIDSEILKYNYDRDIYDVKFHQYLKIIFDLKINYDSFLLYSKIKNQDAFSLNDKLFDYQRLIIIIIDIIENIIILIRNNKYYYELINDTDILSLSLLNKERKEYNLKEDLSELENDIELLESKIVETENELYNLKKKEKEGENTKNQQNKVNKIKKTLSDLLEEKKQNKDQKLESDLYYTYSEHNNANEKNKVLKFYISNNNNFEYYDNIINANKNILNEQLFKYYNISEINLKKILTYKNVKELVEEEYQEDNDIKLIIKIYIYSLLKIKKQNFIKNILTLYIYMSYANILQNFYKESEEFLLGNNIINYDKNNEHTLCKVNLYKNLQKFDYVVERMKSLLGYSFINEYINDYKINKAELISTSCPYVKISLNDYDTNAIILMLFRKSKNDNLILDCDDDDSECHLKEKLNLLKYKDYYKNLKESFLIEIENNRYNIHDFNFIKKTINNDKIVDIIEFIIDDRYSKICKTSEKKEINNINILSKDSSHINDIYENDVELLEKYNKKLQKQKKELDNINDKYSKYKYHYEKLKYKNNIYYFILFLILIVVIVLNIAGTNSYIKTLTYLIILAILAILIIYNYFTKVNLSIVEKFSENEDNTQKIFYDYFNISKATVDSNFEIPTNRGYYSIKIILKEEDKYKLKIRKFKNLDKNTNNYVNNLVKKHLKMKYNNRIENIIDVTITDSDPHYYYITNISFKHNEQLPLGDINDVVLVKNDESIIKKLLTNIDNYMTIKGDERNVLCNELSKTKAELEGKPPEYMLQRKNKKKIYIYTVRNDLLRYINNKFINLNKIIESIELEKANNLANKVHKNLTNEKKNLLDYQKQYDSKKIKNLNVNNLFKHEIIGQSTFINFIILFIFILILLLMLVNIFPKKLFIIMIIGFVLISVNIYNYILNSSYRTRKDATKKYW